MLIAALILITILLVAIVICLAIYADDPSYFIHLHQYYLMTNVNDKKLKALDKLNRGITIRRKLNYTRWYDCHIITYDPKTQEFKVEE